ncbi:quinone-dependent dihydroorotate dehydrogenase [Hyphobacterium sp. CCMP332]|uniref:quinone-dependent dihydroorotate dehydrogenase n=1 Tax=Hyphobacterium sp. CCMP332 TaxID=2749086 RepID=UPI00164F11F7|nr:quinone-dependent dihydroorotate dehydrogenase [Hyphobacterium sp. CCMP332]QNL19378.1 quinone-dependent dihydroorotate dehydrogenase [Hyphobacterium sp. CCMP332]
MSGYLKLGTKALHAFPPEMAHGLSLKALKAGLVPVPPAVPDPILRTQLAGLDLPNPVGLAAGYDKNGEVIDPLLGLGFGFVECGAVTPRPQAGNPKPRVFRLTQDRAVINRMGFNNAGLVALKARLSARLGRPGIVGVNLGANKDAEDRAADYVTSLTALEGLADFFTVNISSPNTPGLRALQSKAALDDLLKRVMAAKGAAPVFLKVAPDLKEEDLADIAASVIEHRLDALIVSNTTIERPESLTSPDRAEGGGLSGRPLFERSTALLRAFAQTLGGRVPLVGVGGIEDAATAYAKIRAGASAVQLYSALVYKGPGLVADINRGLAERLKADGYASVGEAVGVDV